jgi:hypothetical protein
MSEGNVLYVSQAADELGSDEGEGAMESSTRDRYLRAEIKVIILKYCSY